MANGNRLRFGFSIEFKKILEKMAKRNRAELKKVEVQVYKIISNPIIGKPLRNVLKNYRRVHIESFVLIYKIEDDEIMFIDYDHHDRVYKKYSN
ncbi:MAG: type II toxin-antitoxin system mRNA interferase toxin, RelE/StbE family [Candidatus Yonathbacteria bacterium]|nr:type II toxin-antitoxin system mRNA interferase toxin, RelE/StbE family [Candidatus Yonathbacteria bacterium]